MARRSTATRKVTARQPATEAPTAISADQDAECERRKVFDPPRRVTGGDRGSPGRPSILNFRPLAYDGLGSGVEPAEAGRGLGDARAIWNGTISFGLVNMPVRVYPATRRKDVRFHEIDSADGPAGCITSEVREAWSDDGSEDGFEGSNDDFRTAPTPALPTRWGGWGGSLDPGR